MKISKIILPVLISLIFLGAAVAYWYFAFRPQSQKRAQLSAVEIKDYQGEKLSSINDFRENSIKGSQYIDRANYRLKISGLKSGEKSLSYADILNNYTAYKKVITLNCVEGWSVDILWEGPLLKGIISRDDVPDSAKTIIFRAVDGYSTSFPMEYVFDNDIIIANKMNGVELPPERGFPFQLAAESKWGYKWIKWITEIEFSPDANYQGYWESKGYSDSGDLNKNFFK